jgi:CRISPR/Cas system-associated exonuclease Cas4 (RecB family)
MLISSERPAPSLPTAIRLSKSKFLSGLQCHKRLYMEIHTPGLATQPNAATKAILDMGTEIGELARQRLSGGVLVDINHRHAAEALKRTQELVNDPSVPAIFEGAFIYEQVLIRVDILERVCSAEDGTVSWRLIEVKSSTRVKEIHIEDLAVQAYVLAGAGIQLVGTCLMHINTQYVYDGKTLDLAQLFAVHDLSDHVRARQVKVITRLAEMKAMLASPVPPDVEPSGHCQSPYECPFWDSCTKEKPARWIFHLPGGAQTFQSLAKLGVTTIDDIPAGFHLSINQRRMRDNVEWMSPRLKGTLETVRYPVHHLDFETFMPAIPKFPHTRPYQTIPTQWSNHVESGNGDIRHDEYLCPDPKDPREELVVALLESLGQDGSICVYSGYERAILERLAELLPILRSELQRVMTRLWDLFPVIRDHYYHPAFEGSYSIKSVLPAVVPSLSYGDLEIQEGAMAAQIYYHMVFDETDLMEKARMKDALMHYCGRDTLAMVELRRALYHKVVAGC